MMTGVKVDLRGSLVFVALSSMNAEESRIHSQNNKNIEMIETLSERLLLLKVNSTI